jgi:UDP-N-acetylglucosamine 2-epimerase (non-hydrolysing)
MPRTIVCVVGARPNFMKMAPLLRAMRSRPSEFRPILVHTGQHYDAAMSDIFFAQLGIPEPDLHLGVGGGTHASQTAGVMTAMERLLEDDRPDLVLVVGDVNSTLAAAVAAAKACVPLAHVEAGLRSFDRRMPEEVNRLVTDALSSYLFVTEQSGVTNLAREGLPGDRVFLVGNVMIDTLDALLPSIRERRMAAELRLTPGRFGVVTLHRPSNVDDEARLEAWVDVLGEIGDRLPLVFPAHPRTTARLASAGLSERLAANGIRTIDPLPYVEFLSLVADSQLVLTDSGGIQEETTVLGVPCLTLRDNTERPVTVRLGTNRLIGAEPANLRHAIADALAPGLAVGHRTAPVRPPMWDGHAAERIVEILAGRDWTVAGIPS